MCDAVSIPDKDTLKLFSYSAGLCNFCKTPIVEEHFESLSNFGERAHVYGKRKGSARFIEKNSNDNSYSNLILLCAKHHKLVDDHPKDYPANLLFSIKSDHEMRIRQNPLIQSYADVALIKGIFSIFNLMYLIQIANNQNVQELNVDILNILDIENSLIDYYQYDYPFKHPELQLKTQQMFYFLRELNKIFHNDEVFEVVDLSYKPHFKILPSTNYQAVQDAWKYFNLFRISFNNWYSYCKANYGV